MSRPPTACLLVTICAALAGCTALEAQSIIAPTAVREAVQSRLSVALTEASAPDSVAALTDVQISYALRTTNERLLVVVFDSNEATVQLTGAARSPDSDVVVVRNVVAVYDHDRGTISRLAQLRSALRSLDRQDA